MAVGIIYIAIFNILFFPVIVSYTLAVFNDPGKTVDSELALSAMLGQDPDKVTLCLKCNRDKPARAHHCSVCDRCVLKMDHHCPWINNCVGEGNYKAFYLLLVYFFILFLFCLGTMIHALVIDANEHPLDYYSVQIVIALALLIFFGCFGTILFVYHTYIIRLNETTIENTEINNVISGREEKIGKPMKLLLVTLRRDHNFDDLSKKDKKSLLNINNLGTRQNFKSVLGSKYSIWPFPWKK